MWRRPPESNGLFTHQAVNASFCTQPAVSVIAGDFDRHGFNTRHFTFRLFDDFSFETTRFCPAQIHTPSSMLARVLCFRTARPRLNIEAAVGAVIFAREHAAGTFLSCAPVFLPVASSSATASLKVSSSSAFCTASSSRPETSSSPCFIWSRVSTTASRRNALFYPAPVRVRVRLQTSGCSSSAFTSSRRSFYGVRSQKDDP